MGSQGITGRHSLFSKRMSPPRRAKGSEPKKSSPKNCPDAVSISQAAASKPVSKGLLATAFFAGAAALSLASALSPTGGAAVAETPVLEQLGSPFELVKDNQGRVVVHLGIGDEVVDPLKATHREHPEVTDQAWLVRGQTVCEQAQQLGGTCDFERAASIPTIHGDMIVEQNSDHSLDIYSNDGGHVSLKLDARGVDVETGNGSGYFHNDGSIIYR